MKAQHSIFKRLNHNILMLLILLSIFVLIGFGCGGGSSDDGTSNDTPNDNSNGVQLSGDPISLALDATYDFSAGNGNPLTEIEDDPVLGKIVRSIIEIGFSKTATIQDVNDLLESIDGLIINMLEDVAIVIVRIPDPGSILALETIIQDVESNPIVRFAGMGHIPDFTSLPSNYAYNHTDMTMIDHNLAVRGHAAWNLRSRLRNTGTNSLPLIIVPDQYGRGRIVSDYGFDFTDRDFLTAAVNPEYHGYHVIGIIGAKYGGAQNDRGWATGLYPAVSPDTLKLRVIDFANGLTPEQTDFKLIELIKANLGRNIVVNTSYGFKCRNQAQVDSSCNLEHAEKEALKWIEKVRDAGVEDKFIHITPAGNIWIATDTEAKVASRYAAAKLLSGLEDCWLGTFFCTPIENIANVLVVENQRHSVNAPYSPICLNSDSKYGGNISAIGTNVWSLYDPGATAGNFISGTSMASPQVAALAAYVWALKPGLSNQEVINILAETSRDSKSFDPSLHASCSNVPPAPIIDAYAAALAVDTPANASVRMTLLDIATNGKFDENDILLFLFELEQAIVELDYSRYDLNGDGYTGGDKLERFDLDINNPPTFTNVTQDIEGGTVTFNEEILTDTQILCYYAYSDMYSGDTDERKRLLDMKCGDISYDYECQYSGGTDSTGHGVYEKDCLNSTTNHRIKTTQNIYRRDSQIYRESIYTGTFMNDIAVGGTEWINASYMSADDYYCIVPASGWIVRSVQSSGVSANFGYYSGLWPGTYSSTSTGYIFCWQDWSMWYPDDCGTYICPAPGSLQPADAFPGDCHQWWDHEDEDGVMVRCNY